MGIGADGMTQEQFQNYVEEIKTEEMIEPASENIEALYGESQAETYRETVEELLETDNTETKLTGTIFKMIESGSYKVQNFGRGESY